MAYLREEVLSRKERVILTASAQRLLGELEAPEEPPGAMSYVGAWICVLGVTLYMAYYLLTTGSQFGRKVTRHWLRVVSFSLGLYFVVIKPAVILIVNVAVPDLVHSSVVKAKNILEQPRYPFETPLPESSVFYLLQWHPELAGTRLADHASFEVRKRGRSDRDGLTDALVAEIHEATISKPEARLNGVLVVLIALLFGLHEDIQDTLLEEIFSFVPLVAGPIIEFVPMPGSSAGRKGGDIGTALGIFVCVVIIYVMQRIYEVSRRVRMVAAKSARKAQARGPGFRWLDVDDDPSAVPPPDSEEDRAPVDEDAAVSVPSGDARNDVDDQHQAASGSPRFEGDATELEQRALVVYANCESGSDAHDALIQSLLDDVEAEHCVRPGAGGAKVRQDLIRSLRDDVDGDRAPKFPEGPQPAQ